MRVSLRPDLERFVEEKVRAGHYADPNAVVNGALEVMRAQEAMHEPLTGEDIEELRRELAPAIDQADRGEFVEFDAEQIIAEGRERLRRQRGT